MAGQSTTRSSWWCKETRGIKPELVARVGELTFPQPLLEISPAEVETKLLNNLPVRAVSVQRRGTPARLEIDLVGQLPIARDATAGNTLEKGAVDERGH